MRRAVNETYRIRFGYVSYSASVANIPVECLKMSSGLSEPNISFNKPKSLPWSHKPLLGLEMPVVGKYFRVAVSSEHNE